MAMSENFYQLDLPRRRRMLADQGFVRSEARIWEHADGRAIGEGVAVALTDKAFCRFLELALEELARVEKLKVIHDL